MNTRTAPTRRTDPKLLKKYPMKSLMRWVSGGEGVFLPYWDVRLVTWSWERPCSTVVESRLSSSSTGMVCHSRSARSTRRTFH